MYIWHDICTIKLPRQIFVNLVVFVRARRWGCALLGQPLQIPQVAVPIAQVPVPSPQLPAQSAQETIQLERFYLLAKIAKPCQPATSANGSDKTPSDLRALGGLRPPTFSEALNHMR